MTTDALGMLLGTLAIVLTLAMFVTKQSMLGFPSGMFWAIIGGFAYEQSSTVWDIHYFLFFGAMGMTIFSVFAAYGLRTKKEELAEGDEFIDEGKDDVKFIDEGGNGNSGGEMESDDEKPRRRTREIRDRASRRRDRWG